MLMNTGHSREIHPLFFWPWQSERWDEWCWCWWVMKRTQPHCECDNSHVAKDLIWRREITRELKREWERLSEERVREIEWGTSERDWERNEWERLREEWMREWEKRNYNRVEESERSREEWVRVWERLRKERMRDWEG